MPIRSDVLLAAAFTLSATAPSAAVATSAAEPKTAAAVRAADDAWGDAETRGDAAFVDRLLLPGYRSIGLDGKVTTKAKILEHTLARRYSADARAQVAAWRAAHPTRADVAMVGNTAVLTWVLLKPGADEPVSSCDIFIYREGHWRAFYSQHTDAAA